MNNVWVMVSPLGLFEIFDTEPLAHPHVYKAEVPRKFAEALAECIDSQVREAELMFDV